MLLVLFLLNRTVPLQKDRHDSKFVSKHAPDVCVSLKIWSVRALSQRQEKPGLVTETTNLILAGAALSIQVITLEPAPGSLTAQLAGVSHFASLAMGSELSDQNDHR